MSVFIYALYNHRIPDSYRYVGHTSKTLYARLRSHQCAARGGKVNPLYDWMRAIGAETNLVQIRELVRYPWESWEISKSLKAEAYWINRLKGEGHDLLNMYCMQALLAEDDPATAYDMQLRDSIARQPVFWGT